MVNHLTEVNTFVVEFDLKNPRTATFFCDLAKDSKIFDIFLVFEPEKGKSADCVDFGKISVDFGKLSETFADENIEIVLPVRINDSDPAISALTSGLTEDEENRIGEAKISISGLKNFKLLVEK